MGRTKGSKNKPKAIVEEIDYEDAEALEREDSKEDIEDDEEEDDVEDE